MTSLRLALPGDSAVIGQLAEQAELFAADLIDTMIAPYFEAEADDLWIVADSGGGVDGFAFAAPEQLTAGTYNLLALAVGADLRSRGTGAALLAEAERRLRDRGARILLVETSSQPSFEPAIAFYLGQGFTQEARIRDYWAAGDDKLIFRKAL